MKPIDLASLSLQIPVINLVETRNILGGGGYGDEDDRPFRLPGEIPYDDGEPKNGGELPEVIVTGEDGSGRTPHLEEGDHDPDLGLADVGDLGGGNKGDDGHEQDDDGGDEFDPSDNENSGADDEDSFDDRDNDHDPSDDNDADSNHDGGDGDPYSQFSHLSQLTQEQMQDALSNVSESIKNLLEREGIRYYLDPELSDAAHYYQDSNVIVVNSMNPGSIEFGEEIWHAVQDKMGILVPARTSGTTNCEFEAKVMNALENAINFEPVAGLPVPIITFIYNTVEVVSNGEALVNFEYFNQHVEEMYQIFTEHYKNEGIESYYAYDNPDWTWNWEQYLSTLLTDNSKVGIRK